MIIQILILAMYLIVKCHSNIKLISDERREFLIKDNVIKIVNSTAFVVALTLIALGFNICLTPVRRIA